MKCKDRWFDPHPRSVDASGMAAGHTFPPLVSNHELPSVAVYDHEIYDQPRLASDTGCNSQVSESSHEAPKSPLPDQRAVGQGAQAQADKDPSGNQNEGNRDKRSGAQRREAFADVVTSDEVPRGSKPGKNA